MSESRTPAPFGPYLDEPPLSPASPFSIRTVLLEPPQPEVAPPTPVAPQPDPERSTLAAQLRCYRLLSREQIAQAFRGGALNFEDVLAFALERGWIAHDDPFVAVPVESEPELETIASEVAVFLRLANGERLLVGRFPTRDLAASEGRHLSFRMAHEGEWPLVDGRYVRPEAVVSIDVETLDAEF